MISLQASETASNDAALSISSRAPVESQHVGAYGNPWPGKLGTLQPSGADKLSPGDISPQHSYGDVRFAVQRMDVETFNRIKQWQRSLCASTGRKLTNSQVLRMLILSVPPPADADMQKAT